MLDEVQKLDEGEFKLLDIGNMFLDCADQVLTVNPGHRAVRTAMVFTTPESYKAETDALRSLIQSDEPTDDHVIQCCRKARDEMRQQKDKQPLVTTMVKCNTAVGVTREIPVRSRSAT